MLRLLAAALLAALTLGCTADVRARQPSCVVERVIDGDTFVCDSGIRVRLLQINAPELKACGGEWAGAALRNIFLKPGTVVRLDYDEVEQDRYGRDLAAPIVTGADGADYNISIVMVYVGLAKAAYYGDNAKYLDWARASETWAKVAQWNMWTPGGPFNGATSCG
jgi:micrococcal nuclease